MTADQKYGPWETYIESLLPGLPLCNCIHEGCQVLEVWNGPVLQVDWSLRCGQPTGKMRKMWWSRTSYVQATQVEIWSIWQHMDIQDMHHERKRTSKSEIAHQQMPDLWNAARSWQSYMFRAGLLESSSLYRGRRADLILIQLFSIKSFDSNHGYGDLQ